MNTLDFILKRYKVNQPIGSTPIKIPFSRWDEMPALFRDLGFKKGVEVGVYKGIFTKALCEGIPGLDLTGVDAWEVYGNYDEYEARDLQSAHKKAISKVRGHKVRFIKNLSMSAVKDFDDESLDFVFIDANHDYEHVVQDIAGWSKKVRTGGIVCGHDYIRSKKFNFGVIEAVNGWCRSYNINPLFIWKDQCPSWMYVK